MTPAIFLDRDGTMIHDARYLSRREQLRWYPWTVDVIRLFNRAGYRVVVVTNQGGIGLGYYPEAFVHETHQDMDETIRRGGGRIDGWFHCPHHPQAVRPELRVDCDCRKPRPGMVRQAVAALGPIDLVRSHVIGDKSADAALARAIGATGWLVLTGHGAEAAAGALPEGTRVAANLAEAAARILAGAEDGVGA